MRLRLVMASGLALLAACSPTAPADSARVALNNPYWERVNVQLVVTRSSDCDNRGEGYVSSRDLVMVKNRTEVIHVPNGAHLCWRRDRDPGKPVPGVWTGWTKATLFPGGSLDAEL